MHNRCLYCALFDTMAADRRSTHCFSAHNCLYVVIRVACMVGFASVADRDRLEAFLRRSTSVGFRPATAALLETICSKTDDKLFTNITSNSSHFLYHLLPPKRDMLCSLRPRAHDFTLSTQTTFYLMTIIILPGCC